MLVLPLQCCHWYQPQLSTTLSRIEIETTKVDWLPRWHQLYQLRPIEMSDQAWETTASSLPRAVSVSPSCCHRSLVWSECIEVELGQCCVSNLHDISTCELSHSKGCRMYQTSSVVLVCWFSGGGCHMRCEVRDHNQWSPVIKLMELHGILCRRTFEW